VSGKVRVKICGIQHPEDALAAIDAGADLLGLNFVPGSPRLIDVRQAAVLCEAVEGSGVERVAVFRDASWDEIDRVLRRADFERIQFHGDETEDEVEAVDLPVIKAIPGADVQAAETYPGTILLLDHPSEGGGKGNVWDWSEASALIELGHDVILAGGLDPENVAQALEDVGDVLPWGVDVATGVEGEGHRKDPAKMKAFVQAVRSVEDSVPTVEESE
jgi:phosphoribosylanthranilate isomerase